jgi:hypothetical protein
MAVGCGGNEPGNRFSARHTDREAFDMRFRTAWYSTRVIALATLVLMFSACGGGDDSVVVHEEDGGELVAVMAGVQEAIKTENQQQFESLFTTAATARTVWNALMKWKYDEGEGRVLELTTGPAIERATTDVHVKRLNIRTWYELDSGFENRPRVISTKWAFVRSDDVWKLSGLRIDSSAGSYGDLVREFNRMDHFSFEALGMDWEERIDPSPVISRALRAMSDSDMTRLKSCTVDGALFRAYDRRIELPTIANGPTGSGRYNRESSVEFLSGQIKDFHKASGLLQMGVDDLMPLVNAYRVTSMPRHCKKVKLLIVYDGEYAASDVTNFSVTWSAAYIMQKWLAEVVGVGSINAWG